MIARTNLLPFLIGVFFAAGLFAADADPKAPAWSAGWKIVRIAIPKTGQIEHAFVDLVTPAGRALTLTAGVLDKEEGVALERVEWTGSPVHAKAILRKDHATAELSAEAGLVSRDDALERRPSQVEIEAKFVEMPDAVARELLPLLKDASRAPGKVATVLLLRENERDGLLRSLNQKKGVDLLSAPRVSMKPGQNSMIEVIREFRYATDWEPPDQKNKPWTPTAFETRNVGVTLEAKATVNQDDSLDLHLVPQVVEFLGFVQAGTQKAIAEARPDPKQPLGKRLLVPVKGDAKDNERKSPVFATRKLESDLTLRPGQPVVLLLGDSEDTKPYASPHAGKTLVAIVTATLVAPYPPDVQPGPAPSEPPAGLLPVGVPVQGKPGFVQSPYSPKAGYIDVRGFPAGSEVKDPYSGKVFRLP